MSPPTADPAGHDHISPMAASLTAEAVAPPGFSQSHGAHLPKPTLSSPAADEPQGPPSQPPPVPAKDGDGSSANHHYQHAHQSQQQTATGSPSASDSSKTPTAERADPFSAGGLRMTHRKSADDGDGDARRRLGEQEANTAAWSRQQQQQQRQGPDGSQGRRDGAGLEINTASLRLGQGDNNGGADDDDDNVDGIAVPQPLSAISGRQQSIFEQLDSGSEARSSFDVPPEERGGSAAAPWTGSSSSMERSASGVRFSSAAAAAAVMQSSPTSTSSLQAAAGAGAGGSPSWRASIRNADSASGQQGPARSNTVLTSSYLPSISGGSGSMDSYLSTSASTSSLASSYNNNNTQGSTSDAGSQVPPPLPTAPGVEEVVSPRGNPFDTFGRDGGEAEGEGFYDQQQQYQRQAGEGGPRTQASRSAAAAAAAAAAGSRAQRLHGAQRGGVATDGQPNPEGEETGHADAMEDDEGDEDEEDEDDDDALHPPIFTRSISSPLPSRVKHLRHPMMTTGGGRRESHMSSSAGATRKSISANDVPHLSTSTASSGEPSPSDEAIVTPTALQTLSLELADSLQSAIQTLLHLSPPHLLDSAKEQYSGCTVQLPTTSLSALLTAMKGLNYLSANVAELCSDPSAVDQLPGGVIEPAPPARPGMGQQSSSSGNSAGSSHSGRGSARTSRHGSMTSTVAAPQIGSMETSLPAESFPPRAPLASSVHEDFDIGELLQSSADLLGGLAAQAGVDLVLFHGDVGIKHVSVRGDGEGLAYALSHVLRQIIAVCRWGDILELGLQIHQRPPASALQGVGQPHSYAMTPTNSAGSMPNGDESGRMSPGATMGAVASDAQDDQGLLYCSFEIIHNLISDSPRPEAVTPKTSDAAATFDEEPRHEPDFGGILSRRLLKHVNASLRVGSPKECTYFASGAFPGSRRSYTLSVQLPRGQGEVSDLTVEEEAARQPYPSVKLAKEPTLAELSTFAESLRTKKVDLHASLRSVFARHLTSYLAAWGMDISHFAIEDEVADAKLDTPGALAAATLDDKKADRLVIIDDDVNVLKKQLLRIRAETSLASLRPRNLQRPGLTTRARSSPHIRQIQQQSIEMPSSSSTVIHFTSLSRYNHVRDVVSSILAISPNAAARPEVVVIPKPVGPRRFLTALHTAISKPIIDPFFTPIATSPRSPGGSYFSPIPSRAPSSLEHPVSRAGLSGLAEEGSGSESHESIDRVLGTGQSGAMPIVTPSGELVATPAFEYFAGAAQKMGASAASGIMVQSPDGRPVGMFFEPPAKADRRASLGAKGDSSRRRSTARSSISSNGGGSKLAPPTSLQQSPTSRRSASLSESHPPEGKRGSQFNSVEEDDEGEDGSSGQPVKRSSTLRRKPTNPSTGSLPVAIGRDRASTITQIRGLEGLPGAATVPPSLASLRTNSRRSILQEAKAEAQVRAQQQQEQQQKQQQTEAQQSKPRPTKKAAANKDSVVVPPINVLIVEDNPINQNILSMFLFKRKIKHQAANNGQEAVEKWRSGTFHLILVRRGAYSTFHQTLIELVCRWISNCQSWTVSRRQRRFAALSAPTISASSPPPPRSRLARCPRWGKRFLPRRFGRRSSSSL